MRRVLTIVILAAFALLAMGCATLFAPGPDMVPLYTEPPGAAVKLDGMHVGRTPCIVPVPRSSEGVLTFELAGFEPATVDLNKVVNGPTLLNLLGGYVTIPVFFFIDIVTGNIGKYSTEPMRVVLKPMAGARPLGCLGQARWR